MGSQAGRGMISEGLRNGSPVTTPPISPSLSRGDSVRRPQASGTGLGRAFSAEKSGTRILGFRFAPPQAMLGRRSATTETLRSG